MRVAVLVPRRADGGRRDQLWEWVRGRWAGWDLHEGHHDDGWFNRSAAINQASRSAGDWDVAVIADSDSFVSEPQLHQAIGLAVTTGKITLAFDEWAGLGREVSDRVMAGDQGHWDADVLLRGTCSSMVVVTRDLWDQVYGFDPGFVGWGAEDVAFWRACDTLGGGTNRVPGTVWHLYHDKNPESLEESENRIAGWARLDRYAACADDPHAMRALLDELRCA